MCRYCGHHNRRSARFCEQCGERISFVAVARTYMEPAARRFGWLLFLSIPIALVILLAVAWIAGGLGFGAVVLPIVNKIILGIGIAGALVIVSCALILTYKDKPRVK
jgi:hypothetical protein